MNEGMPKSSSYKRELVGQYGSNQLWTLRAKKFPCVMCNTHFEGILLSKILAAVLAIPLFE